MLAFENTNPHPITFFWT